MTTSPFTPTRRSALAAALAAGTVPVLAGTTMAARITQEMPMSDDPEIRAGLSAWDWLAGEWAVRHRRLDGRLVGSTRWEEFDGTCTMWKTMGGQGNVDDNVLHMPQGTYRAVGIRAFDPQTGRWAIWWLDARNPTVIEAPVYGGFENGVGTFIGEQEFNGRNILVRFQWTGIAANSAHWDQAFSPDGGATWETNWHMDFTRIG